MSDRQGPVEQADPKQALRTLIERGEGASATATMLRLMWLRQDHPAASVTTEAVHLTDTSVVIRATIAIPQGGSGSGLAAATVGDITEWAASVERAETNAISRALDTLGYMLERATALQPASNAVAPAAPPQPSQQGPRSMAPVQRQRPTPIQRPDESAPPVVNALRRAQSRPQAVPPTSSASDAGQDEDAPLAEYSWTGFWNTARSFGLDARRIEEILGRPAHESSPREAVEALRAAGAWGPPEGSE